ncbi:YqaI family protein [Peribacillus sp. TH24]|uniref:YqaI family protein n=1 Tax=Peribacillus sp. TH24 TaxID=2798483 RepID=UPI0037C98EDB
MPKEDIEHQVISQTIKTGYPNLVAQPEHAGIDFYGHEILIGDSIVMDPSTGEIVLKENLEGYLSEVYGFSFKKAE